MSEIKNFILRSKNGTEDGVFTGRQPRQAALKAANRIGGTKNKPVEIRLRERGTKKVHIFNGWKEMISAPKNKPAWMPDKINKPFVKKVGIETLEKI
ncbi:MAG: chromosomal protein MC1 [Candidatus Methanoperedens sp.]|nr:chromosomal protein MC1 [Candidatus Methanoperedens sp.]